MPKKNEKACLFMEEKNILTDLNDTQVFQDHDLNRLTSTFTYVIYLPHRHLSLWLYIYCLVATSNFCWQSSHRWFIIFDIIFLHFLSTFLLSCILWFFFELSWFYVERAEFSKMPLNSKNISFLGRQIIDIIFIIIPLISVIVISLQHICSIVIGSLG